MIRFVKTNSERVGENPGCGGDVSWVRPDSWPRLGIGRTCSSPTTSWGIGLTYQRPGPFYITFNFLETTDNLATDNARY